MEEKVANVLKNKQRETNYSPAEFWRHDFLHVLVVAGHRRRQQFIRLTTAHAQHPPQQQELLPTNEMRIFPVHDDWPISSLFPPILLLLLVVLGVR
jgi:hypothetical protein